MTPRAKGIIGAILLPALVAALAVAIVTFQISAGYIIIGVFLALFSVIGYLWGSES
jgi:hypothetical protein